MSIPTPGAFAKSTRVTKNEKLTAQELQAYMNKEGIGVKEFAEIFGVTIQAVKLWLNGGREFSVTNSRLIRLFMKYPILLREF